MHSSSPAARLAIQNLRASSIREVANAGMGHPGVLAFWFGEPDEVTPAFIRQAGIAALDAGETFYVQNCGLPVLRDALAGYVSGFHRPVAPANIAVTSSGMNALALVEQALIAPGDRVVVVTPLWPNLVEGPKILGAEVTTVPLAFTATGWQLDLERLLAALTPQTHLLIVNSPNNPTGWTLSMDEQQAILAHCRRHGIWIVADDAYERLYYREPGVAPSFLDLADVEERVISTNTFSKSWLMTGWRLGWIVAPSTLMDDLSKLIEYNTSCTPGFVQRAGVAAVMQGEPVVAHTRQRLELAQRFLVGELQKLPGIGATEAPGAMYSFFRVEGMTDSLQFCKRLVATAGLGLAPGIAFGPEGEGFIRWCFASSDERLADGVARLAAFLRQR
ncbi:MAG: pyridoxal phosphate-dependent aminotransferase [Betaproteobacteria bacterium]